MKVQNNLITENTSSHLTAEGLYLYVQICSQLSFNKKFSTNRDVLIQQLEGVFGSKRTTIVSKLNEALAEILEKTSLIISDKHWNESSTKALLEFSMPEHQGNHTQVPFEIIEKVNDVDMFYIYVCVARWRNKGEGFFKCPYTRWAELLRCSERTAKSKIKEAVKLKLIFVNRGDYLKDDSKRQDINEYSIKPIAFEAKTTASKVYEKAEISKNYERVLGYGKTPLSKRKGFLEYARQVSVATLAFQNTDKNFYPKDDHYYAVAIAQRRKQYHILAPEEIELLEAAKLRMKILSTNPKLKSIVYDKIEKAKKKVSQIANTDILFITYQEKTKYNTSATAASLSSFEQELLEADDPFGED